ncbi:LOW QUALITY PROTEIN: disintegrin and metalloproteinase domain-containing protein 10-like [Liolophura sinensis]|uniref:LOW QUALITY PROTEIN: disintegrin and metalloproteinase domain-containing protein 10-like n=1 Tax=Liolophura sinensis TaxID=3198878 RepID=UPI0031590287
MRVEISLLLCVILDVVVVSGRRVLDDYVRHYEPLHYDRDDMHGKHLRAKRSSDQTLHLEFKALGKKFKLRLQPDRTLFTSDHVMEFNGKATPVDTSFIYSGYLADEPKSWVHGAVINGTFRGTIFSPETSTYHIEPSDRYFPRGQRFPSVIYSEEHLILEPYRHRRSAEGESHARCGLDHANDWMDKIANSAVNDNRQRRYAPVNERAETEAPADKYLWGNNREKRATSTGKIGDPLKNTCTLFLRSDPMLMNYMTGTLKYDTEQAKDEILSLFASHVDAIKRIYMDTKFETYPGDPGYMYYQGVTFSLQRTAVMTSESEKCGTASKTSFCEPNIDVSNFLNLNSQSNHDDYCLAYVFTYRDFSQGTLGLAWVGSPSNAKGGICERYAKYDEGKNEVWKSLNTGVITLINYGKPVPPKVSQLTFAHEVGHNFGSPHDKGDLCTPYGKGLPGSNDGNYIMFSSATSGDRLHNSEFSPCSKDNITRVMNAVFKGLNKKYNCFTKSGEAFCGNGIVEKGEECDCGYEDDCPVTKDPCCYPKGSGPDKECKLKNDTQGSIQCSPSQGPCCNKQCTFIPASQNLMCKAKIECAEASSCNGLSASCPPPVTTADLEFCLDKTQVCMGGVCQGSVCKRIKWEECFISSSTDDVNYREKQCYLACYDNATRQCVSSNAPEVKDSVALKDFRELLMNISAENKVEAIKLPAGSPCNNFEGYCDVFHKCRGVDAEGPLARLKNLIFNPQTLQTVRDWIEVHWWAVLLMCIGLVIFMALFIKFCAVHTPSSNPNKPPARKLTQTLNTLRRHRRPQQPYQPTRSAGPPPPYEYPGHPAGGPPHGRGQRQAQGGKPTRAKGQRGQDMEMAAKI